MIPHHDFEKMAVEIILAIVVIGILAAGGAMGTAVILGILFGILPDLENLLWKLGRIRNDQKIFPGHVGILKHGAPAGISSIYLQAIFTALVLAFFVWRS